MFKKLLCWLLIFQHINVYVLHASAGDFSISFSREDGELHSPKLIKSQVPRLGKARVPGRPVFSLKLQRELESGGYESLYNISYLFTEGKFKEEKVGRRALVQTLSLTEGKYLGIISSNPEQSFSLYLYPDGRAHLQGLKSSRHLEVQTFGDLVLSSGQRDTQGKVRSLALTAANISNERRLFVEELTLRTLEASGTITNTQGAHLEIGKSACVQRGRFENQGWFHAHNGKIGRARGERFS